jgi:hypothetical protein
MIWYCDMDHSHVPRDLGQAGFILQEEEFVQHLFSTHRNALPRVQLLARTRRSKTERIRDPFTCPLCDCQPFDVAAKISEKPYDLLANYVA